MNPVASITATGSWFPDPVITNAELCAVLNEWVRAENERNAEAIAAGDVEPLRESSPEFIEKASGITQRHVWTREGILDPERMYPVIPERPDDEMSIQCEMALNAARPALEAAGRSGEEVDMIVLAGSNLQRMYPAVSMELQQALGASGFAMDMTVGCSSATFPVQLAVDTIAAGHATCALLVNPELMCPQIEYRDRDSHFIFGDGASAMVIEPVGRAQGEDTWDVLGTKLWSQFSSNIRNNRGFVNRSAPDQANARDKLFTQQGRRVFKDIVPLVPQFVSTHLDELGLKTEDLDRLWLHQANINMDQLIAKRLLGRPPTEEEMPTVLHKYANTASAGSILAFHDHRDGLDVGSMGIICSFGAGYSIGNVVIRRRS